MLMWTVALLMAPHPFTSLQGEVLLNLPPFSWQQVGDNVNGKLTDHVFTQTNAGV